MAAPSGDDPAGFPECAGLTTIRRSCSRRSRKCLGYLAERDAEGGGRVLVGSGSAAVSHRELTPALTTTMTTVGLPDTFTYTTTELVSCLVEPSACAHGSEGSRFSNPTAELIAPSEHLLSSTRGVFDRHIHRDGSAGRPVHGGASVDECVYSAGVTTSTTSSANTRPPPPASSSHLRLAGLSPTVTASALPQRSVHAAPHNICDDPGRPLHFR
jgi:hypothetical protein